MNLLLRNHTIWFISYLYNTDTGKIEKSFWGNSNKIYYGHIKKRFLCKSYAYWIDNKRPIFQYGKLKINLYDENYTIKFDELSDFIFVFTIFYQNKQILRVKYFRLFAYLDLDIIEKTDFDFFYKIYFVWSERLARVQSKRAKKDEL